MPLGKPAGVRCVQLDATERCALFGNPARPAVCASLQPSPAMCGADRGHAMRWLARLERSTAPRQALPAGGAPVTASGGSSISVCGMPSSR